MTAATSVKNCSPSRAERRSPLRCGGAASPAAPERESAASCHPPRYWPFRRGTMRSTAASTSWDGATSLAGFQVSTTGRFWVSTEADVARGRPATRGDIAQTSDLGAQGVAHGVLELTAIPGRAGRLVLAGLQCGQRRSHLALETALVGRQALDDPLELPLQ